MEMFGWQIRGRAGAALENLKHIGQYVLEIKCLDHSEAREEWN